MNRLEYIKEWQRRNPDKVKAYKDKWLRNNPEKRKEVVAKDNKKRNPITKTKLLVWTPTGKRLLLKEPIRKGVCIKCGRQGLTHIHHIQYHDEDPLKDILELCPSCHMKESWLNGDLKK